MIASPESVHPAQTVRFELLERAAGLMNERGLLRLLPRGVVSYYETDWRFDTESPDGDRGFFVFNKTHASLYAFIAYEHRGRTIPSVRTVNSAETHPLQSTLDTVVDSANRLGRSLGAYNVPTPFGTASYALMLLPGDRLLGHEIVVDNQPDNKPELLVRHEQRYHARDFGGAVVEAQVFLSAEHPTTA